MKERGGGISILLASNTFYFAKGVVSCNHLMTLFHSLNDNDLKKNKKNLNYTYMYNIDF